MTSEQKKDYLMQQYSNWLNEQPKEHMPLVWSRRDYALEHLEGEDIDIFRKIPKSRFISYMRRLGHTIDGCGCSSGDRIYKKKDTE